MTLPDVVGLTRTYLASVLAPVEVATRVPRDRPAEWVQIRRVGGTALEVRDVARLDVLAWAATEPRAYELGSQARAALWALAGKATLGPMVYVVAEFMGPRQVDDDETGTPQLWFTLDLHVRADELIHRAP